MGARFAMMRLGETEITYSTLNFTMDRCPRAAGASNLRPR